MAKPSRPLLRCRRLWLAAASGALLVFLAGCNTIPSQVGAMIAKRLPAVLGPADRYSVGVDGSILDAFRGKLDSVHVHGDNVAVSPTLHVHSFDATAYDIHANTRTDAIESIGQVTFHIELDQSDLDNYMLAAKPDDYRRGARITLGASDITYSDSVRFLGLSTPFSLSGRLSPHLGNREQMDFTPSKGSVARVDIPLRLLNIAVERANPVVDLTAMKYPVAIASARVESGTLQIDGTVDLSSLIGTDPAAPSGH